MRRIRQVQVLLVIVTAWVFGPGVAAEQWPQQSVRIIVPFPAGGAVDVAARLLADGLAKRWNKPVVVENRPGGETIIGVAAFLAARDGHTLLYTTFGSLTVTPIAVDKLSFDPNVELVPLVPVASIVVALSVSTKLPVASLPELEALIRLKPGQLAWASAPTLPRYVFETFLKQRGLVMNHVAYRDAFQPQVDLGEGRIHALITSVAASHAAVSAGRARFIAVTEPRRTAILADVPTAAEAGYDEFTFVGGAGLFGWRDISATIRDRVVRDVNALLSDPLVGERLAAGGQHVIGGEPETLLELIKQQEDRVHEISKLIELKSTK